MFFVKFLLQASNVLFFSLVTILFHAQLALKSAMKMMVHYVIVYFWIIYQNN